MVWGNLEPTYVHLLISEKLSYCVPGSGGGYEKALFMQCSLWAQNTYSVCIPLSEPWGDCRYRSDKVLSISCCSSQLDWSLFWYFFLSSVFFTSLYCYYKYLLICLFLVLSTWQDPCVKGRGQLAVAACPFQHVSSGSELKLSGLPDIFTHWDTELAEAGNILFLKKNSEMTAPLISCSCYQKVSFLWRLLNVGRAVDRW